MSTSYLLHASGPESIEDFAAGVRDAFGDEPVFEAGGERFTTSNHRSGTMGLAPYRGTDPDGFEWVLFLSEENAVPDFVAQGARLHAARPQWAVRAGVEDDIAAEWPAVQVAAR